MFQKKKIIQVNGMHCVHCAKKVEDSIKRIENVKSVKVNLDNKNVTIKYKGKLDLNTIQKTIEELEYEYVGVLGE